MEPVTQGELIEGLDVGISLVLKLLDTHWVAYEMNRYHQDPDDHSSPTLKEAAYCFLREPAVQKLLQSPKSNPHVEAAWESPYANPENRLR